MQLWPVRPGRLNQERSRPGRLQYVHAIGDAARRRGRGPDRRLHNVGLDVRRDARRRPEPAAADDERYAVPGRRSPALRLVPVAASSAPGSGLAGSDPPRVARQCHPRRRAARRRHGRRRLGGAEDPGRDRRAAAGHRSRVDDHHQPHRRQRTHHDPHRGRPGAGPGGGRGIDQSAGWRRPGSVRIGRRARRGAVLGLRVGLRQASPAPRPAAACQRHGDDLRGRGTWLDRCCRRGIRPHQRCLAGLGIWAGAWISHRLRQPAGLQHLRMAAPPCIQPARQHLCIRLPARRRHLGVVAARRTDQRAYPAGRRRHQRRRRPHHAAPSRTRTRPGRNR